MRRITKASFFETALQLAQDEESKPPFYKVVNRALRIGRLSVGKFNLLSKDCLFNRRLIFILNYGATHVSKK